MKNHSFHSYRDSALFISKQIALIRKRCRKKTAMAPQATASPQSAISDSSSLATAKEKNVISLRLCQQILHSVQNFYEPYWKNQKCDEDDKQGGKSHNYQPSRDVSFTVCLLVAFLHHYRPSIKTEEEISVQLLQNYFAFANDHHYHIIESYREFLVTLNNNIQTKPLLPAKFPSPLFCAISLANDLYDHSNKVNNIDDRAIEYSDNVSHHDADNVSGNNLTTMLWLEFGIYKGKSLKKLAEGRRSVEGIKIFGFDSFEGLPDDWRKGFDQGKFALSSNEQPKAIAQNVKVVPGLFQTSLPPFVAERLSKKKHKHNDNLRNVTLLHIDCDIYSSTCTVFKYIEPLLADICYICFDELCGYQGFEFHEARAFFEFLDKRKDTWKATFIGQSKRTAMQVLFRLDRNKKR
eukprot:g2483.t1